MEWLNAIQRVLLAVAAAVGAITALITEILK
jgi:hypothetical protein